MSTGRWPRRRSCIARPFNRTFQRFDLGWDWDRDLYTELLQVTGGKERVTRYIEAHRPERRDLLERIGELHQAKSAAYLELLGQGALPLRPGVARLIGEARAAGVRLAIATTTTPDNVAALLASTLGPSSVGWFAIAAGDMAARKKPDPAVYEDRAAHARGRAGRRRRVRGFRQRHRRRAGRGAAGGGKHRASFSSTRTCPPPTPWVSDLGEPGTPARAIGGHRFAKGHVDLDGTARAGRVATRKCTLRAGEWRPVHFVVIFPTLTSTSRLQCTPQGGEGRLGGFVQREVKYIDRGVEHVGTFEVDGWMLELKCASGRRRVALGLFEPKALARKLLRALVANAERETETRKIVAATPPAAAIAAAKVVGVASGHRRVSAAPRA